MRMRIQSLVSLSGLRIWHCCKLGHRLHLQLSPVLLWLWHRLAAASLILPLAQELPYATGAAVKKKKMYKCTVRSTSDKREKCGKQFKGHISSSSIKRCQAKFISYSGWNKKYRLK